MRTKDSAFKTVVVFLVTALAGRVNAEVPADAVQAAMAGEWHAVARTIGTDASLIADPSARLFAGHACLALNRNNESLCLFLSATSDSDLQAWDRWTKEFVERHEASALAAYLRGDASARLAKWDEAIAELDRALKLHSNHPLVRNARGIAHAAKQHWDDAIVDFATASQADPRFADAHASLGVMWIQKNDGAKGALAAFDRALEVAPNFTLAQNGRACALIQIDRWDESEKLLNSVRTNLDGCLSPVALHVSANLAELARLETDAVSCVMSKLAGVDAGMSLEMRQERIAALSSVDRGKLYAILDSAARWNKIVDWGTSWMEPFTPQISMQFDPVMRSVSIGATWDSLARQFDVTRHNMTNQLETLDLLRKHSPDVRPMQMNAGEAIWKRIEYRDLIKPSGGVTTETLATARVDRGNWNVVTFYGLAYPVAKMAASGDSKSDHSIEKKP